jgi:hypothetical protein
MGGGGSAPIGQIGSQTRGRLLLVRHPPACRALVSPEGEPSPLLPPPPSPCLKTIIKKVNYQNSQSTNENLLFSRTFRDEGQLEYIGFDCIPAEDLLPQRKHTGSWDKEKAY